ncbi:MAG: dihydrolipoamide acetyltransferase family protein, partial [bacterium]
WKKNEGDQVEKGDVLAELETDKTAMDLEAEDSGVLLSQIVQAGEEVPPEQLIAVIGEEGEDVSQILEKKSSAAEPKKEEKSASEMSEMDTDSGEENKNSVGKDDIQDNNFSSADIKTEKENEEQQEPENRSNFSSRGEVRISPVARKIAQEHNLDISRLRGSGAEGRIVKEDVEKVLEEEFSPGSQEKIENEESNLKSEKIKLKDVASPSEITGEKPGGYGPLFSLQEEINLSRLVEVRGELARVGRNISVEDFIFTAVARTLTSVPQLNATFEEDFIQRYDRVNLMFEVVGANVEVKPTIDSADKKTISEIHEERSRLVERAKNGEIQPGEARGGTFSVGTAGYNVDYYSAVFSPPRVGILSTGAIKEKPVVEDGTVKAGYRMGVILSCDQRAVTGAQASEFLQKFQKFMENPVGLV